MKINLSSRERKLLYLLGGLVIIFVAYKFIFLPTTTKYTLALEDYTKYISEESQLRSNIMSDDEMRKKIEELKEENRELSTKLPPELHQENIIMDMIEIFGKHEVELLSMTFDDENRLDENEKVQSIDDALELYEESMGVNNDKMNSLSDILKGKGAEKEEEKAPEESNDIKYLILSISCEGIYTDIKELLLEITETRSIVITKNITLGKESTSIDKIVATLEFNFPYYEDNSTIEVPIWEDTNNIDKEIKPFDYYVPGSELDPNIQRMKDNILQNGVLSNYESTVQTVTSETEQSDFYAILKPKESDNFAFTIGKSGERMNALHSDLNNENLQFIFEKTDGVYYYSLGNTLRPIDSKYIPSEFEPHSDKKLILSVQSQPRLGTDDTASAMLNIINRTDLPVEVQVKNDDKILPRVIVKAQEGNILVKDY